MNSFKDKIQQLRHSAGYTQREIATFAGITAVCYQMYEYGKRIPDARTATLIAKALHTTVENLWGGNSTK